MPSPPSTPGDGSRPPVSSSTSASRQHSSTPPTCGWPGGAPACVSVFAGRLADLGVDYRPIVRDAVAQARRTPNVEIIWASTREVLNVIEADEMGCHIITAPADILKKLPALGTKTGAELSLDAVKAFRADAVAAGLTLKLAPQADAAE